jgi:ketosteroid isomerase-like protein
VFWFRTTTDKDVTIVSDKPTRLRDGTPAQELELQMVKNGKPYNWLGVGTKKGDMWINVNVGSFIGKIGEDMRAIPYSLQYAPGKDEPVKVPPDVQEFLDKWCSAIVAHDIARVMTYYSDRFLNSGNRKGEQEQLWKQYIGPIMSFELCITELVSAGDRVYLAGFSNANTGKWPLPITSIIKENGEWKWYGNQRDVSPYNRIRQ